MTDGGDNDGDGVGGDGDGSDGVRSAVTGGGDNGCMTNDQLISWLLTPNTLPILPILLSFRHKTIDQSLSSTNYVGRPTPGHTLFLSFPSRLSRVSLPQWSSIVISRSVLCQMLRSLEEFLYCGCSLSVAGAGA